MTIEALAIQRLYADVEIGFSGKYRTKTWHICIVMSLFVYDLSKRSRYDEVCTMRAKQTLHYQRSSTEQYNRFP